MKHQEDIELLEEQINVLTDLLREARKERDLVIKFVIWTRELETSPEEVLDMARDCAELEKKQ